MSAVSHTPHVLVDGVAYEVGYREKGGITRVFNEILPRICGLDKALRFTFFSRNPLRESPPRHPRIRRRAMPPLVSGRFRLPLVKAGLSRAVDGVMRARVRWWKADIWHSTYFTLPCGPVGHRVVTVFDMIHEMFPQHFVGEQADRFRAAKRRCVEEADAILCISETTRRDLEDCYGISDDRVRVTQLGCAEVFRPLDGADVQGDVSPPEPYLLYVGSRSSYKGFDTLLQAYGRWDQRRDIRLAFVGRDWTKGETDLLHDRQLASRVVLHRAPDDEALRRLYGGALAFVYPSRYEGFGIPLLEAMACGCPIVASRIPATQEVAADVPVYFDAGEEESLLAALDAAVDGAGRSFRTAAGMRRAKEFSWDRTAERTLAAYRQLTG